MKRRSRRTAAVLLSVGLTMVVTSAAAAFAQTTDGPQLGFFDVTADATGIGASFGNPETQPYPVAAGFAPNALAQLSAGPSGRAVASVLWPGPLLANAGSLANVIGTPLPPEVVANANYPVAAKADAGGGSRDEETLGPMNAVVDGSDSSATAALSDVDVPDVVTAARVVTTSHSYVEGGAVISEAESELKGVAVGGLKIASIRTLARATTDGVEASVEHEVELSGVTYDGQGATIDTEGIHVGSATIPLGPVLGGVKPVTDGFGVTAFVTKPLVEDVSGGAATVHSGSLVVQWALGDSGHQFIVVLGGAAAKVRGTPGSAAATSGGGDFFNPAGPSTPLPPAGAPAGDDSGSNAPSDPGDAESDQEPETAEGPAANAPLQSGTPFDQASPVSDRVPLGWMLIGIVGACLMATGLHGMRAQVLDAALTGTLCPLERS